MKSLLLLIAFGLLVFPLFAEEIQLESDAASKNYAKELPRIPPTEPNDALAKFAITEGFRIELAAHEPLVTDPISIAFDESGRLFVVCMNGYSEDGEDNLGVVKLLEDTDKDGKFDSATDYVTGLSWPTAVACYDGGIFVAAAPDIFYCKDTDGDKVADQQRVVFTGFARNNVQGMLNSFRWGLDNRLYGASGTNGGNITALQTDKANNNSESKNSISLRGRDFSIDPASITLRPESGGAQHGATFDRSGNRFVCSNSDHLQWVEHSDIHLRRNPLLSGFRSRQSIAIDGPSAEVYRTSPVEPWRIVRTRLRVKGMVGGPVEGGGRAAGYFTSASGVTAYTGNSFPAEFGDNDYVFVGDVGSNLVHLKRITTNGLTKKGERATDPQTEFLTSTDNWFRPVQFANGPDGAMYIIDMYREVIEHPLSLPPMIKQHLDLTSGRSRGRIYRVVSRQALDRESKVRSTFDDIPATASDNELIAMLGHPNGWHRETAARLIVNRCKTSEEAADSFASHLREACKAASPHGRIRALYCLQSIDRLAEPTLGTQLLDKSAEVRRHALIVLESATHVGEATTSQLERLVNDEDIRVRYQLALALGRFPAEVRRDLLIELATNSKNDRKMQFAVLSSMADDRLETFRAILVSSAREETDFLLEEIARQIGQSNADVDIAMKLISTQNRAIRFWLTSSLLTGSKKRGASLLTWLSDHNVDSHEAIVRDLLKSAEEMAGNADQPINVRLLSLQTLGLGEFQEVKESFRELLLPTQSAEIRNATVELLGKFASADAAQLLIQAATSLPPTGNRQAYELLTSRSDWAVQLLESVENGDTSAQQISAVHRNRMTQHRNPMISKRAKSLLGVESDRTKVLATYQKLLASNGNAVRGKTHFRKVCSTCHRLDEFGTNVGPDLAPLRNRGAAYLLANILDPNREVDSRYAAYTVITTDGRNITGLLASDSAESIELIQANNTKVSISKSEIEQLQTTGQSLMPEGLERDLGEQGVADVIAYLVAKP